MPNLFAYVVLYSWPIIVIILFKRLPVPAALAWSIIGGYLLLPSRTGFDLPLIPTIDKTAIPSLMALLMCVIVAGAQAKRGLVRRPPGSREAPLASATDGVSGGGASSSGRSKRHLPQRSAEKPVVMVLSVLLGLMLVSPIVTVLQNPEPIIGGNRSLPGLALYDAFSMISGLMITVLPFLLARRFLDTAESHVILLKILAVSSLGYSVFAVWELRMGPFLNLNIYGFAQSAFLQHVRDGGFRPIIFLQHGLWVAVLTGMSVIAAAAMWRVRRSERKSATLWFVAAAYLLAMLVFNKSFGALVVTMMFLPCVILLGIRMQMLIAAAVAAMILVYPMMRGSGLIPVNQLYSFVESFDRDRAGSLLVRLVNEEALLAKANRKPLAGWGGYGRNRVMDALTGDDLSITDGMWIITIGTNGWLGYLAQFSLLCLPIMLLLLHVRHVTLATAGLSMVLMVNLIDLIPNATLTPITWLVAGALMGRYINIRSSANTPVVYGKLATVSR